MITYEIELNYSYGFDKKEKWCAELYTIDHQLGFDLKTRLGVHLYPHREEAYRFAVIEMNEHKNNNKSLQ